MAETIKQAEGRGYTKGYKAGVSRGRRDAPQLSDQQFWEQAYCAALTGTLMVATWQTGTGERWITAVDYANGAANITDRA